MHNTRVNPDGTIDPRQFGAMPAPVADQRRIEKKQPLPAAPIADGPTLAELPCPHRGEYLGKIHCGCSGRPDAFACDHPSNANGLAMYPSASVERRDYIIRPDGSKQEFEGKPARCSICRWRMDAIGQATRLPIDDGELLRATTQRGIITGAQAYHWPCLGALAIAAARYGLGLAVADHGLSEAQAAELQRCGVQWIDHDKPAIDHADNPTTIAALKAWWKPWICAATPFEDSLWIDADAVLVADPSALWDSPGYRDQTLVSDQSLFMGSGAPLYHGIASHFFGREKAEKLLKKYQHVNTGIVCFPQSHPILCEWQAWSLRCLANSEILALIKVRDQTSYLLAMMDSEIRGLPVPRLMPTRFNTPVDYLTNKQVSKRSKYPLEPSQLLETASRRHPEAAVVHWLGRFKPWTTIR